MALTDTSISELTYSIARMSGYFGSMAQNDNIPARIRIRMFEKLIEEFTILDPQGDVSQGWIAEWKKEIEKIQNEGLASKDF